MVEEEVVVEKGSETCLCHRVVIRMEYISLDMRGMDQA